MLLIRVDIQRASLSKGILLNYVNIKIEAFCAPDVVTVLVSYLFLLYLNYVLYRIMNHKFLVIKRRKGSRRRIFEIYINESSTIVTSLSFETCVLFCFFLCHTGAAYSRLTDGNDSKKDM